MTPKLLTVKEVSQIMDLKPARIYELSRLGKLPFLIKIGDRQYRYSPNGLQRYMDNGGNQDQQISEVKNYE